jgi:hypothetical protein
MTVTLNEYNTTSGCLHFTIFGGPSESTEGILTAAKVQKSLDNGINWIDYIAGWVSPRCGFPDDEPALYRIQLIPNGETSNIISSNGQIQRTPITKVTFVNSPVHLRIQNTLLDNTIRSCTVRVWIWTGSQEAILGNATVTYKKSIVSLGDDYIGLEISDVIKSYLEKPTSSTSINQPAFGYNINTLPAITGQGIFFQVQADVTSVAGTETIDYPTNFATLGWLWDYEQNGLDNNNNIQYGSLGFPKSVVKWFNPNVPKYFKQSFVLDQEPATCTTSNMILLEVETKTKMRCTRDSSLIVYLDKRGLWDVFTPHGKISISNKVDSEISKRIFRDPSKINNSTTHSKSRIIANVDQLYTLNTGSIDESDVQRVEELIYSPKVYLIRFLGDIINELSPGLTIDSTYITVDDINITIDQTVTEPTQVPYFATFQQIPVIVEDSDFIRKTLLNDRSQIDYNIKLMTTTNKINNIR